MHCICPSNIKRGYITVLQLVHQMIENLEDNTSHCPACGSQALTHNTELHNTYVTTQGMTIPYKMHEHIQFQPFILGLEKYTKRTECL